MDSENNVGHDLIEVSSEEIMSRFFDHFRSNDMLNQFFKIEHRQREYKIYCDQNNFLAYRINPKPGISPGFPGWITCMVTHKQVIDDNGIGELDSGDPNVQEWLDYITNVNFKISKG